MNSLPCKYYDDDRLPVLLSGEGGVKLLGVPKLPVKSGQPMGSLIADASFDLLDKWGCSHDILGSMVFDTTASNTGHLTAACVTLQIRAGRALLWTACRHHVGEVILTHVWNNLKVEPSSGPEVSIFKRFQSKFSGLTVDDYTDLVFDEIVVKREMTETLAVLQSQGLYNQARDDYKELIDLCIVYMSGSVHATNNFSFKQPGALHKARWSAKVIYAIKLVLMQNKICSELPKASVFSGNAKPQINKLVRFVRFVTIVYVKWWVTCPLAVDAPFRDLELLKALDEYSTVDPSVAEVAKKAFSNHLWYLAEDLVPMALFSDVVPNDTKQNMVDALLKMPNIDVHSKRSGTGFGKPVFPDVTRLNGISLADFVGQDSWLFFRILNLDRQFLEHPVETWTDNVSYNEAFAVVRALRVVNDSAERGVKLAADFLPRAKIEKKYQAILQVVENDRHGKPSQRFSRTNPKRSAVEEPTWFLKL